jgi:hypothetical protein
VCTPQPQCTLCHGDVIVDEDNMTIRHQVFDLPPITPVVTEYLRLRGVCSGCGHKHHGALPACVPSGQLGARALALVGTLSDQFHLTQGKIQRLLKQVMRGVMPEGRCAGTIGATPAWVSTRITVSRCTPSWAEMVPTGQRSAWW